MENKQLAYAGFWVRVVASLIDTFIFLLISLPLLGWIYGDTYLDSEAFIVGGWEVAINWVAPFIGTVTFWVYRGGTPGKIILKLQVVHAETGAPISVGKSILRYVMYYVSTLPLLLGFIWILFNKKKQGWHDLVANTVVIRPTKKDTGLVTFEKRP